MYPAIQVVLPKPLPFVPLEEVAVKHLSPLSSEMQLGWTEGGRTAFHGS